MKIRNGFVSNSSSSSFLIIGKKCSDLSNLTKADIKKGITAIGKYLWEGKDVFNITDLEMLGFVRDHSELFDVFTESEFVYDVDGANIEIGESDVGKVITGGVADQASSTDVIALKENYEGGVEDEEA